MVDPDFSASLVGAWQHLFSSTPVFLPRSAAVEMHAIVTAIEAASRLVGYRSTVVSWAPKIAQSDYGPAGAFMGYDFHLDEGGPKLIEINTNAGGAFLNAVLARAHTACCTELQRSFRLTHGVGAEGAIVVRRQLRRRQVLPYFEKRPSCAPS